MKKITDKFFSEKRRIQTGFFLISGPCVIEDEKLVFSVAEKFVEITSRLGIDYIFKASFDKANRSSSKALEELVLKKDCEF